MPRPPLSPSEIAAFRERIADVASKVIAERGYEAVTMRAIAELLGLSAMALYRYVPDKEGLLALARTHAYRRFADAQMDAASSTREPAGRVRALGKAYVAFAIAHPDWYRIMFQLDQPHGENAELEHEVRRSFSYLLTAVEEAVAADVMRGDALTLAHLAWANVHGLVSLHLAGKLNLGRDISQLLVELEEGPQGRVEVQRPKARRKR